MNEEGVTCDRRGREPAMARRDSQTKIASPRRRGRTFERRIQEKKREKENWTQEVSKLLLGTNLSKPNETAPIKLIQYFVRRTKIMCP